MITEAKDVVLRMINFAQDKSIEELATHVTDVKQGFDELRSSDLRSLVKYVFSIDINERGFFDSVGSDFPKRINGAYVQHMASMNAIEGRIKRDAPAIADEASMDIRIIKYRIERIYRTVCSLYQVQDSMEDPLSADGETTRSIESEEDLNALQKCILDCTNELERQKLRKFNGMVCEEVITEKGQRTRAWKPVCTIKEKLHQISDKDTSPLRWKMMTTRSSMPREVATHLEEHNDFQFPEITKNRHAWSFRNGLFVGDLSGNKFYPYGSVEISRLDRNLVTSKYFNQDFDDYTGANHWSVIPTPFLDSIMNYQGWEDDVKKWMYIMIGRMTFEVNEADAWQVITFCKGIAQSGKSTLLNFVVKLFYEAQDIAVMSNNMEEKFGLSAIHMSKAFIGPEIKRDFKCDQASFQSLVSGEEMSIAVKNQTAQTIQWKVPGMLAGNELPGFSDNSGSILRRLFLFVFKRQVSDGDPRLCDKLSVEIGLILQKCIWAYVEAVKDFSDKLIWKVVPKQFIEWREEVEGQLHNLLGFMKTSHLRYGNDLKMPLSYFRSKYREYCSSVGSRARPWQQELYEGPFSQKNVRIVIGTMEWLGTVKKDQEILYGVTMSQDED